MDVSVILPVVNEAENLRTLIPRLIALLDRERLTHEIVVVDGGSSDGTRETAEALGARVVAERRRGYAGAMETGFAEARGDYLLTLDADQSHDPDFIVKMWRARNRADIVIASPHAPGGVAYSGFVRRATSWLLNVVLRRMLSMPVRDMSSGYRLYRREVLANLELNSTNFEVLEEILVKAYASGFSIVEVPFTYFARGAGRVLDAGCGSSLIVQSLNNVIGMDYNYAKLRFLRRYEIPLVNASAFALPFKDSSFDCL